MRTEDELRAYYAEVDAGPAEARLLEWVEQLRCADELLPGPSRGRRALTLVLAVAATIIVAVVVSVSRSGSGSGDRIPPANSGGVTSSAPTSTVPVTAQAAQALLVSLLPRPGTITSRGGSSVNGHATAVMVYDDGRGPGEVDVDLSYPVDGRVDGSYDCDPRVAHQAGCTEEADGSVVYRTTVKDPNSADGPVEIFVSVRRPDGLQVQLAEWNSPHLEGLSAPTRQLPPFSVAELLAIAHSPRWTTRIAADVARRDAGLFRDDGRVNPAVSQGTPATATGR